MRSAVSDAFGRSEYAACIILGNPHKRNITFTRTLIFSVTPLFSVRIEEEIREWQKFRRALRREDQNVFDQLFEKARLHSESGGLASRPWPFEMIRVSILLEEEKEMVDLRSRLKTHEDREKGEELERKGQEEIG